MIQNRVEHKYVKVMHHQKSLLIQSAWSHLGSAMEMTHEKKTKMKVNVLSFRAVFIQAAGDVRSNLHGCTGPLTFLLRARVNHTALTLRFQQICCLTKHCRLPSPCGQGCLFTSHAQMLVYKWIHVCFNKCLHTQIKSPDNFSRLYSEHYFKHC